MSLLIFFFFFSDFLFPFVVTMNEWLTKPNYRGIKFNAQETNHPLIQAFRSQVQWLPRAQDIIPFSTLHPGRPFAMRRNKKTMETFLETELEKRFTSLDLTGDLNSPEWKKKKTVIDLALKEYIKEARAEGKNITKLDDEFKKNAISQLLSFIFAGHDTTSSSICVRYHHHLQKGFVNIFLKIYSMPIISSPVTPKSQPNSALNTTKF